MPGRRIRLSVTAAIRGIDYFAAHCVKEAQTKAKNIRNCLVIPYLSVSFQERIKEYNGFFDEVIYPALENVPPKYAIIRRNEWMVDRADLLIAYITHGWGGAALTYHYAKRKGSRWSIWQRCERLNVGH